MHLNSLLLFNRYAKPFLKDHMRVLEIGPDSKNPDVFKKEVNNPTLVWETMDLSRTYAGLTHVCSDEYSFPLPSESYDIVFSSSVIEHVRKIWVWIREAGRVCKKNGHVVTIAPVSWPYHAVPVDCWRIYPEGMKALYEEAGLRLELNHSESLEQVDKRRAYPGPTYKQNSGAVGNLKFRIKKWLGWPLTYAIDTIAVGTKV